MKRIVLGLLVAACHRPPVLAPAPSTIASVELQNTKTTPIASRGMVRGHVFGEHDRPLHNAIVSDGIHTVVTDAHGGFAIADSPLDGYLIVTACGYLDAEISLAVADVDEIVMIRDRLRR